MRANVTATLVTALAAVLAAPAAAGAQEAPAKKDPWVFQAQKAGKPTGRYDFNVVAGDEGVFAIAWSYGSAKALAKAKPGRPDVRAHAELDPAGRLGKYKRWKNMGKSGALYWLAFSYEGEVKVRSENEDGKKSKVLSLGPAEAVAPLEPDQPFLAWLLVRDRAEREVACVSTSATAVGKARVARGEGGAWTVSGDCGAFTVAFDEQGEPAEFAAGDRKWVRVAVPR